jgi:hypothetical protein
MSPSEFDLRAALREGEGDRLDPDSVLAAARATRRERRVRIASVAGAVIVVGGIGAGVGIANLQSSGSPTAGGTSPSGSQSAASTFSGGSSVAATLSTLVCPTTPERVLLPGGGGTGQFGGDSSLFGHPVAAMKICLYPSATGSHPRSVVIQGADAQELANSLDTSASTPPFCPNLRGQTELGFEVLAVTPGGTKLKPVTALPESPGRITNGTAVRYQCSPPSMLARLAAIPTN